jgi:N-acetylmuramoyl-L-alanine amidase
MILAALMAFQLAAATPVPATVLVVRDANHSIRVPLVATANGPMLWPGSFRMLPVDLRHTSGPSYTLEIWGTRMELEVGLAVVRVGDDVRQLVTPPVVRNGRLMVPLQLVSEVFPVIVPNTRWDPETLALMVFTTGASPGSRAVSVAQNAGEVSRTPRRAAEPSTSHGGALPPTPPKHHRRTIVVDAGHGGVDNGMTGPIGGGPRIFVKDVTLAVATKLGEQLKTRGVDVVYTRTTDTLIALDDRGRIANRARGHCGIVHRPAGRRRAEARQGTGSRRIVGGKDGRSRRVERMENNPSSSAGKWTKRSAQLHHSDMKQNQHLRESSDWPRSQRNLPRCRPQPG